MPIHDENAPLIAGRASAIRRPSLPAIRASTQRDADGFAVPCLPGDADSLIKPRPRPLSITSGKRLVPKRAPSSSGVIRGPAADRDTVFGDENAEESFCAGDVSVLGEKFGRNSVMGKPPSTDAGEKVAKDRDVKAMEKRVRVLEAGAKMDSRRNDERIDKLEASIADIRADILIRAADTPDVTFASTPSSAPTPSSDFNPFEFGACASPPVPALLSRQRRQNAMRRMSRLGVDSIGGQSAKSDDGAGVLNGAPTEQFEQSPKSTLKSSTSSLDENQHALASLDKRVQANEARSADHDAMISRLQAELAEAREGEEGMRALVKRTVEESERMVALVTMLQGQVIDLASRLEASVGVVAASMVIDQPSSIASEPAGQRTSLDTMSSGLKDGSHIRGGDTARSAVAQIAAACGCVALLAVSFLAARGPPIIDMAPGRALASLYEKMLG